MATSFATNTHLIIHRREALEPFEQGCHAETTANQATRIVTIAIDIGTVLILLEFCVGSSQHSLSSSMHGRQNEEQPKDP
jgi:hypothetical protein